MALILTYSWSPSKAAFFPNELKAIYVAAGTWPSDPIAVTAAEYAAAVPAVPDGKMLGVDAGGNPARVAIPGPTATTSSTT